MSTNSDRLSLEITVISAEDLRIDGKPISSNAYVAVKTNSGSHNASQTTSVDTSGKSNPSWNEKLHVDLPLNSPFLVLEVRRRSSTSSSAGDCLVGSTRVPVADFAGNYTPENSLRFLSYRLRDASGIRNGIINISVRADGSSSSLCASSSQPELGIPEDSERHGAIVTGVPVWFPSSGRGKSSE